MAVRMARRPVLQAVLSDAGWMVSVPPDLSPDGKRHRKFFGQDKRKAEKFAVEIRTRYHKGERQTLLPPEVAMQAAEAMKLLEPMGMGLLEVVRAARDRWDAARSNETVRDRWLSFTVSQEERWRPRYASDMAKIPRWLPAEFMDRRLHEVSPELVRAALLSQGPLADSTVKMRMARVLSMLSARGGRRRAGKVVLLSREELVRLKWEARKEPEVRRTVGLLLFAGIRPGADDGEISRLQWEAVGEREIYIEHEVSKTGSDRHIPICRRLRWWIREHPAEGPVAPAWWKVKWQRLRRAAGIGAGQDLTRHTFASHFLAVHGDQETKQAMGHTAGSDTLIRHYRRAVTKEQGRRYFGLRGPA